MPKKEKTDMKKIVLLIVLAAVLFLAACSVKGSGYDVAGKTFVWEKEGFGGDFTITLGEDGNYQYYVGFLSSYIGMGEWSVEDGILTLNEHSGYDNTFRFTVKDGEIVFIKEGSSEFMYVTVEDGDRFTVADTTFGID